MHWGAGYRRCLSCLANEFDRANRLRRATKSKYAAVRSEVLKHQTAGRNEPIQSEAGEVTITLSHCKERVMPAVTLTVVRFRPQGAKSRPVWFRKRKKKTASEAR